MDWMVVTSPENFERTRDTGFTLQGFKRRHRKKALRMMEGDRLFYYLVREGTFAAACRVLSESFEDHAQIWISPAHPEETYPWRVRIEREWMAPDPMRPRAETLVDQFRFVRPWPKAHWRLAFQGMLHVLPPEDGDVIRDALKRACAKAENAEK